MGFLKKFFGKPSRPETPADSLSSTTENTAAPSPVSTAPPKVIQQSDVDPPIRIDPTTISHAFITLNHADVHHAEKLSPDIAKFNRGCQPRLWNKQFQVRFAIFASGPGAPGFPDASGIGQVLETLGLRSPYSLVINTATILVGGTARTNLLVGFAYRDQEPKVIFPRSDGCIAA